MGISFSNIGTVGREQSITSGSNGEQNWSYIPSKGKSTKKANNRAYQFADEKNQKADCLYEWLLPSDSAAECQGSMAGNIGRNWF